MPCPQPMLWATVAAGQIGGGDATRLSEAIETRRVLLKVAQAAAGRGFLPGRGYASAKAPAAP